MVAPHLKTDVQKNIDKLATLRDEVRLKLHLASLEAKTEWDEKLAPRVLEVEQAAKHISESSHSKLNELIAKMEEFLAHLREGSGKSDSKH